MTRLLPLLALAVSACASPAASEATVAGTPDAAVAASPEAAFLARPAEALVVDVRTPAEFAAGHLAGARNVDVNGGSFEAAMDTVSRSRAVYLYCRSGRRSADAAERLAGMGFTRVVNAGAFEALAAAGAETAR